MLRARRPASTHPNGRSGGPATGGAVEVEDIEPRDRDLALAAGRQYHHKPVFLGRCALTSLTENSVGNTLPSESRRTR